MDQGLANRNQRHIALEASTAWIRAEINGISMRFHNHMEAYRRLTHGQENNENIVDISPQSCLEMFTNNVNTNFSTIDKFIQMLIASYKL